MLSEERLKELIEWTPSGRTTALSASREEWQQMARELLALRWRPITPEDLPTYNDEVLRKTGFICRLSVRMLKWGAPGFIRHGWTHFRPINAPAQEPRP